MLLFGVFIPPEITLSNFEVYSCVRSVMYYLHTHGIQSFCVAVLSDNFGSNNSLKRMEIPRLGRIRTGIVRASASTYVGHPQQYPQYYPQPHYPPHYQHQY
nr:uncharacterized protein LOC123003253 [Drosophila takahashii]